MQSGTLGRPDRDPDRDRDSTDRSDGEPSGSGGSSDKTWSGEGNGESSSEEESDAPPRNRRSRGGVRRGPQPPIARRRDRPIVRVRTTRSAFPGTRGHRNSRPFYLAPLVTGDDLDDGASGRAGRASRKFDCEARHIAATELYRIMCRMRDARPRSTDELRLNFYLLVNLYKTLVVCARLGMSGNREEELRLFLALAERPYSLFSPFPYTFSNGVSCVLANGLLTEDFDLIKDVVRRTGIPIHSVDQNPASKLVRDFGKYAAATIRPDDEAYLRALAQAYHAWELTKAGRMCGICRGALANHFAAFAHCEQGAFPGILYEFGTLFERKALEGLGRNPAFLREMRDEMGEPGTMPAKYRGAWPQDRVDRLRDALDRQLANSGADTGTYTLPPPISYEVPSDLAEEDARQYIREWYESRRPSVAAALESIHNFTTAVRADPVPGPRGEPVTVERWEAWEERLAQAQRRPPIWSRDAATLRRWGYAPCPPRPDPPGWRGVRPDPAIDRGGQPGPFQPLPGALPAPQPDPRHQPQPPYVLPDPRHQPPYAVLDPQLPPPYAVPGPVLQGPQYPEFDPYMRIAAPPVQQLPPMPPAPAPAPAFFPPPENWPPQLRWVDPPAVQGNMHPLAPRQNPQEFAPELVFEPRAGPARVVLRLVRCVYLDHARGYLPVYEAFPIEEPNLPRRASQPE